MNNDRLPSDEDIVYPGNVIFLQQPVIEHRPAVRPDITPADAESNE